METVTTPLTPVDAASAEVCDRPGCGQPWPPWRQPREPGGPYINPTPQRRPGAKRGNRNYCSPDCADQDNP